MVAKRSHLRYFVQSYLWLFALYRYIRFGSFSFREIKVSKRFFIFKVNYTYKFSIFQNTLCCCVHYLIALGAA